MRESIALQDRLNGHLQRLYELLVAVVVVCMAECMAACMLMLDALGCVAMGLRRCIGMGELCSGFEMTSWLSKSGGVICQFWDDAGSSGYGC